MTAADEQHLILQVKEGSHEAFRVLVERYMKQAYNIAYGFVNNHDDAEDISQESFVRVYESIRGFRGDAAFTTWLYRIVTNIALNRLRQKKRTNHSKVDILDIGSLPVSGDAHPLHAEETRSMLERTLHELPTLQRAVVTLRHLNGLSTKQVSDILRCSEGTVKTHLHRGLKKMKTKLTILHDEIV